MGKISSPNSHSNLKSAVIAFLVPLPSIFFYYTFLNHYQNDDPNSLSPLWKWCYNHPLLLAHIFFFLNVNVLFWVIGLIQSSHWMIDLYWTVIPVLLVHYYATHPLGAEHKYNVWRSRILMFLTWVWSIRLNHNYFRRENWQWGAREDWRFTDMKQQYGKNWWWISFFAIYLSQQKLKLFMSVQAAAIAVSTATLGTFTLSAQICASNISQTGIILAFCSVFLMGICMPMYAVHSANKQLNIWDLVAMAICLSGITIAYHADTQLHDFVSRNNKLKEQGKPVVPNLDQGLWQYSRHPNYFGEQLWWWGLAFLSWNLGYRWMFIGALINSLCLAYVTVLVERRMLKQDHRADAYRSYQKRTSVWIPWFKSQSTGKDKET